MVTETIQITEIASRLTGIPAGEFVHGEKLPSYTRGYSMFHQPSGRELHVFVEYGDLAAGIGSWAARWGYSGERFEKTLLYHCMK